ALGPVDSNGMVQLSAFGDDPQCRLVPRNDVRVEGGWYELSFVLEEIGTRMVDPALYPNCGAGMTEEGRVPLHVRPHADGVSRTLVPLGGLMAELRFDPSIGPCEIKIGHFTLRRVSQAYVARAMF